MAALTLNDDVMTMSIPDAEDAWSAIVDAVAAYGDLDNDELPERRAQLGVVRDAIATWRDDYWDRTLRAAAPDVEDEARGDAFAAGGPLDSLVEDEEFELDHGGGELDSTGQPGAVAAEPELNNRAAGKGTILNPTEPAYDRELTNRSGLHIAAKTTCKVLATHPAEGSALVNVATEEQGSLTLWVPLADLRIDTASTLTPLANATKGDFVDVGTGYVDIPEDVPLFERRPNLADVVQGSIGDCYLLAALSSLAQMAPQRIVEMMSDEGASVAVRLFDVHRTPNTVTFTPRIIRVRKSVPARWWQQRIGGQDAGDPFDRTLFAKNTLWVQMIEKAYAASGLNALGGASLGAQPSYGDIASGLAALAMEHLVGREAEESFTAMQTGVGTNAKLLPKTVPRLPWSVDEVRAHADGQQAQDKSQAYQGLVSFAIFGQDQKLTDQWIAFANKVDIDRVARQMTAKGTAYKKGELRLETFAALFDEHGLAPQVAAMMNAWLAEQRLYPGKRGTGKYTTNQLRLFRTIYDKLDNGQAVVVSTKAEAGRSTAGVGGSGGEPKTKGIAGGHSYSVLSVKPAKDPDTVGPGELLWVRLRNPWSTYGRQYEPPSGNRLRVKKGATTADTEAIHQPDGDFWIELSDLTKRFGWIDSVPTGA